MRNELELMALVDRYLDGLLTAEDVTVFENRLNSDAEFETLVNEQKALRGGMQRLQLRAAAESAYSSYRMGKWGPALGGTLLIALLGLGWFMLSDDLMGHSERQAENVVVEHRDSTNTRRGLPIESTEKQAESTVIQHRKNTDIDLGLASMLIEVEPSENKTLITPGGIVLDIPKGAFVYDDGSLVSEDVHVEFKEALEAADIIKAGLSTMSGNKLLETGGMFYLNASVNGVEVNVNPKKTITAMVPDRDGLGDMQLFTGAEQADGRIDWQDPQPLLRSLVPVDITTLDFYPPAYMPKLAELGEDVGNKKFTDSLYYSFAWEEDPTPLSERIELPEAEAPIEWNVSANYSIGSQLFYANCASCHKVDGDLTGPALRGARARWEGKGDIYAFSKNSAAYLKTGNEYANELFRAWGSVAMTQQGLTDAELDAVFDYADQQFNIDTSARAESDTLAVTKSDLPEYSRGVNPANIKTIWNRRFNNTNLATREFEERLRAVFASCSTTLLDRYVQNLGRDLKSIDSEIANMGYPAFAEFANRNDGKVDLPEEAADRLASKYEEWSRLEADAIAKTQASFWKQQRALNAEAFKRARADQYDESSENIKRYNRELKANLRSVYRQLGYGSTPRKVSAKAFAIPRRVFVVPIRNTGWKNVDRYVTSATTSRTSMNYTDPQTGKTATLTYTPFFVTVPKASSYEQLRVYLLPKKLNSYQRVCSTNGVFEEKLNALFQYDLFVLGIKEGERYLYQKSDVHDSEQIRATMSVVSEGQLLGMLNRKKRMRGNYLLNKTNYMMYAAQNDKRQAQNRDLRELKQKVTPSVYCINGSY